MRCYKIILLFILICSSLMAEEYKLYSLDKDVKSTGDIVELRIENISIQRAKALRNSRITNLLYVLEVYKKDEDVILEAIISETKDVKSLKNSEDTYNVIDLNYKYTEVKLDKEFTIIDNKIILIESKVLYALASLVILVLLIFSLRFVLLRKAKNKSIKERQKKLNLYKENIDRDHLEYVYSRRKELFLLYKIDDEIFSEFELELNKIQYQKKWDNEQLDHIKKKYEAIVINARVKNGI